MSEAKPKYTFLELILGVILFIGMYLTAIYSIDSSVKINKFRFKAEKEINICIDKIASGDRYITVIKPVSSNLDKLLKDEHYMPYLELENNKIIYKKVDKAFLVN